MMQITMLEARKHLAGKKLSLAEIKEKIRSRLPASLEMAAEKLSGILTVAQALKAIKRACPDQLPVITKKISQPITLAGIDLWETWSRIFEALNEIFPVWQVTLDDIGCYFETPADMGIVIEPQGPDWNWDLVGETLENPQDLGPSESLLWFLVLADQGIGGETWEAFKEHFHWPMDFPNIGRYYGDVLFRKLRRRKMGEFVHALKFYYLETGNIFLDYNPSLNGDVEVWGFTAANIRKLRRHWKEAVEFLEVYARAARCVQEDPSILNTLLELIQECSVQKGGHHD